MLPATLHSRSGDSPHPVANFVPARAKHLAGSRCSEDQEFERIKIDAEFIRLSFTNSRHQFGKLSPRISGVMTFSVSIFLRQQMFKNGPRRGIGGAESERNRTRKDVLDIPQDARGGFWFINPARIDSLDNVSWKDGHY